MTIHFTKEDSEHGCFSNFSSHNFVVKWFWGAEKEIKTVEHGYQASKCVKHSDAEKILDCEFPWQTKRLGRKITIINDWDEIKVNLMHKMVRAKFAQNSDILKILIDTGNEELVEYAPWGDTFWGVDKNYVGKNMLGRILMLVREELK